LPLNKDPKFLSDLDCDLAKVFHIQTYGLIARPWLYAMDYVTGWQAGCSGGPLPAIADSIRPSLPTKLKRFDELVALTKIEDEDTRNQLFVYGALLRCGAKQWTDAWAAFQSECATTGDVETAEKKHLLS